MGLVLLRLCLIRPFKVCYWSCTTIGVGSRIQSCFVLKMDSPEYKTLTQCYDTLVKCVKQSPGDVADCQLKPLLTPGNVSFLSNPHHDNDDKARKIVNLVLNQVEINPQVFHKFISALENAGSWTETTLDIVQREYTNRTSHVQVKQSSEALPRVSSDSTGQSQVVTDRLQPQSGE